MEWNAEVCSCENGEEVGVVMMIARFLGCRDVCRLCGTGRAVFGIDVTLFELRRVVL